MRRGRRRLASAPFSVGLSHQQRVVVDRIAGKLRREFASPQASVHALPPHFFCIPAQRVWGILRVSISATAVAS